MLRAFRSPLLFALGALAVLLLAMEVARPCFFLHDDNATWFAGAYAHDFRTLTKTGRIAEVNFYQYGGEPFLEQGQSAVLYPPVYLGETLAWLIPGDLRWAIEWIAAIHLALAVVGFYAWLRQGGVAAPLAALGGLVWALNPFVLILGASWITVTYAAAWLPWLFWAIDRVFARRTFGALGWFVLITVLFVLQGYVQWTVYAVLFAGVYATIRLVVRREEAASPPLGQRRLPWSPRVTSLALLYVGGMVAVVITVPLLVPMAHAASISKARAQPLSLVQELFYRVEPGDLLAAQFGVFRAHFLFDASTALFFCPALLLVMVALVRFARDAEVRWRLFPLLVLAGMALVLSSRWYFLLNVVPFLQHFRWPFKVFLFAEFFLIAALVWGLRELPSPPLGQRRLPFAALVLVLVLQLVVALANHDANFLSQAVLPASSTSLPVGVDPTQGRVIAIDDHVPVSNASRFFMYAYGTCYQVPSLGGYNPLVSTQRLAWALGLDMPNYFDRPITPEVRAQLEARAVRYWIVDPQSSRRAEVEALPDLKLLATEPDRLIYEDLRAEPMAFDTSAPTEPLPLHYTGNSIFIKLKRASLVAVSLGKTDGWWYRVDGGPWQKPDYRGLRVYIRVSEKDRRLEVSFFDPRFEPLLYNSFIFIVLSMTALLSPWVYVYWRKRFSRPGTHLHSGHLKLL